MSYDYRVTTEKLSEYLAEEIIGKGLLEELKKTLDGVLQRLTEEERFLLELRYFRRRSRLKGYCQNYAEAFGSVRNYYRRQEKLLAKFGAYLGGAGLTEEKFFREYSRFDGLMSICRWIGAGKECAAASGERALVCFLSRRAACRRNAGKEGGNKKTRPAARGEKGFDYSSDS